MEYRINGFVFGGNSLQDGLYLLEGTEYAPALSPRRAVVQVPQTNYSIPMWDDPMDEIKVGLKIRIQARNPDNLRIYWDRLMGVLGMGNNQPVTMTRVRGSMTETAEAQLVSTDTPDFNCPQNRLDLTAVMNIPLGAWRGPYAEQSLTDGAGKSLNTVVQSTRPIIDAMIRVPGPLTSVRLYDNITDTGINWGGGSITVPSGQFLVIDCLTMQARVGTSSEWRIDVGTNASGALTFVGDGPLAMSSRWTGNPPTAVSNLTVTLNGGSGPVTVRSRKAVV